MPTSDPTTSPSSTSAQPVDSGIYRIRNIINGKVYIGSAKSFRRRWKHHRSDLSLSRHHSQFLQHSWNKYGRKAFVFEVLEYVPDLKKLVEREQHQIDFHKATDPAYGYNLNPIAGSRLGAKATEATRAKLSASNKGKKKPFSDEHRANIAAARKGVVFSAEHRANMSAVRKGIPLSKEHVAKTTAAKRGRCVSPETRAKISAAQTGKTITPEAIAKSLATKKGKPYSAEARVRMAAGQKIRRERERLERLKGVTHG